jgi:transposase, IS30 family
LENFLVNRRTAVSYTHFTRDERVQLGAFLRLGLSRAHIAQLLGKHPSSISRELARNSHINKAGYHARVAGAKAQRRRALANFRPVIVPGQFLDQYIPRALACELSPEQIVGRLRFIFGVSLVCIETIYHWIYFVHPELQKYLRCTKGKYRRKRGTNARWLKRELAKKTWITERPEIASNRSRVGDWEGDTVHGAAKSGYIATLVERKSGYLVAAKLENPNGAEMLEAVERLRDLPPEKRLTLTLDNGFEMSEHEEMERRLNLKVYFAHPYHSWERGTNENTNGLLRQYFPKKTSFAGLTQADVDRAVKRINMRPRKRLGYQSPQTVFWS